MNDMPQPIAKKDLLLLSHLRKDARASLTNISKATHIPISTLFDRLRAHEGQLIKRHTCLVDVGKLGYDIKISLLVKVEESMREDLRKHFQLSPQVNSCFRVNNGFDFLVEAFFRNMRDMDLFMESMRRFRIQESREFFILEDMKREAFLSDPAVCQLLFKE